MIGDYGLNDEQKKEKRHCCSIAKDGDRRVFYNGYPLYLPSEDVLEAFKKAYPDTDNASLKAITGRSTSYNSRIGNYLGLEKSEAFKERRQSNSVSATKLNHTKGKPKKGVCPEWLKATRFGQPGVKRRDFTEEDRRKMSELRREMLKMERMRESWGIPRKTKLRIGHQTKQLTSQRYTIRHKGYKEVAFCQFVYTDKTNRSKYYESISKYTFYSEEEWEHRNDPRQNVTAIRTWDDKQGGFNFV